MGVSVATFIASDGEGSVPLGQLGGDALVRGLSVENGGVVAAGIAVGNARIGDVGGIIGACLIAA